MLQSVQGTLTSPPTPERSAHAVDDIKGMNESRSGPVARWQNRMSLAPIAAAMDVPVVIATYPGENDVRTIATHGIDLMYNWACLAAACDDLCLDGVVVIPDTRSANGLANIKRHWPDDDNRFLVGIPLRDASGRRVGSLCVMNNIRSVARSGISFRILMEIGKMFTQTGQLQVGLAKT